MQARFEEFLEQNPSLLPQGATVLVAFSGGPDSTVLLHLLLRVAKTRQLDLRAAHYDHGLRSGSADEADLAARRARAWGVPCTVGRAPEGIAPRQATLRAARYRFLCGEAARTGAHRIATGHQADDQAETVLFRLLRGTGLHGLGGIPLRRGSIVRPLLPFWREEIRAYQRARKLPSLEDPSNYDRRWSRSRVRHDVLPALRRATGQDMRPRLVELARRARKVDRALEEAAREALRSATRHGPRVRVARVELGAYDRELQARAIRLLARQFGVCLRRGGTRTAVEFIKRGRSGTSVDLAEGLQLWREFDVLWLGSPPRKTPDQILEIGTASRGSSRLSIGGQDYRVDWGPEVFGTEPSSVRVSGYDWLATRRWSRAVFPLRLRGPRPGDRIRLLRGDRKLKQLFNELRIPVSERVKRPVLETAGRVLWVAGVGETADPMVASTDGERFCIGIRSV